MNKRPVVIWGLRKFYAEHAEGRPIPSHAFIHAGYFRAFESLGFQTQWLDDEANLQPMVPDNAIVFCVDIASEHLPRRPNGLYIGHNLTPEQTAPLSHEQRLSIQYWFKDCPGERINSYTTWSASDRTLYQPWATDFLPHEISDQVYSPPSRTVFWVGSVWKEKDFGNTEEIAELQRCLSEHNIEFRVVRATDKTHAHYIRNSFFAPSVQGAWQISKGYIPCRALKNASYGQLVVTNNPTVRDLFNGECVYGDTIPEMVRGAMACCCGGRERYTKSAIKLVRSAHTYVHRVNRIMEYIG